MTGAQEVQSLQGNVIAALTVDRMNFEKYGTVEDMLVATHFPDEIPDPFNRSNAQTELISAIAENRTDVHEIMYPPLAKVSDVIKLINKN